MRLIDWIAFASLSLNLVLLILARRDRLDEKRRSFAEAVVAERIKLAAELLAAFLVRIGQISDLAIYTDQLRASDGETNQFAHRSREKLLYERGPEAIQRLNGALAAAHAAFSREALLPAFDLLVFLQRAIEDGPPFDADQARSRAWAAADALRSEIRVEEAVSYQKKLFQ